VISKLARQPLEQLGMAGRVFGMQLIEWMHKSSAEESCPETVGHGTRKQLAVLTGQCRVDQLASRLKFGSGGFGAFSSLICF
jgi:hypothetical protein